MTRQEAVDNLIDAWCQRDSEFCCSKDEDRKSEAELVESLRAIGVTDDELGEYYASITVPARTAGTDHTGGQLEAASEEQV